MGDAVKIITVDGELVPVPGDELFFALWLDSKELLASERSDLSHSRPKSRGTWPPSTRLKL